MKVIFLTMILFFSINCFSARVIKWSAVGKTGNLKAYALKAECEAQEGQTCYDISNKDPRWHEAVTEQVDDKSKPLYKNEYNVTACADQQDCSEKFSQANAEAKVCDQGIDDFVRYRENTLMPGWQYYCTGITGYEQKTITTLKENTDLKTQILNEEQAAKTKKEGIEKEIKDIEFGKRIMAIVGYQNAQKGLNISQIQELRSNMAAAEDALSVGAIEAAKAAIEGYTADGTLLRQQDKDEILAEINAYLGE